MKKRILLTVTGAAVLLLAGCASTPTALGPVGPNPGEIQSAISEGQLEVFTAPTGRVEGDNPTWFQYSSFYIYDRHGKRLEHVANSRGYYSQRPAVVNLPPGKYIVEGRGHEMLQARVGVVIKSGRTTRVYLDGSWQPPPGARASKLVISPRGLPIGWRAE